MYKPPEVPAEDGEALDKFFQSVQKHNDMLGVRIVGHIKSIQNQQLPTGIIFPPRTYQVDGVFVKLLATNVMSSEPFQHAGRQLRVKSTFVFPTPILEKSLSAVYVDRKPSLIVYKSAAMGKTANFRPDNYGARS